LHGEQNQQPYLLTKCTHKSWTDKLITEILLAFRQLILAIWMIYHSYHGHMLQVESIKQIQ